MGVGGEGAKDEHVPVKWYLSAASCIRADARGVGEEGRGVHISEMERQVH